MNYRVYICQEAVDAIAKFRGKKRKLLANYVRNLEDDPFNEGDFSEHDDSGREYYTKIILDQAISFYPDHALKEIKVLQISRADR